MPQRIGDTTFHLQLTHAVVCRWDWVLHLARRDV
jgi:hypothetical protein